MFCISSNNFGNGIRSTWQELQVNKEFCDVTLACSDGKIEGHKIIMSHSSPVLKDILKQTSGQNPVIYLRGVEYKTLESLVTFLYQGKVSVIEEDLYEFFEVTKNLKIRELSEMLESREPSDSSEESPESMDDVESETPYQNQLQESPTRVQQYPMEQDSANPVNTDPEQITTLTGVDEEVPSENNLPSLQQEGNVSSSEESPESMDDVESETPYQNQLQESPTRVQQYPMEQDSANPVNTDPEQITTLTGVDEEVPSENNLPSLQQEGNVSKLGQEKPTAQGTGLVKEKKFSCDICDKKYSRSSHLKEHKASKHEGTRFSCDKCDAKSFSSAAHLKKHKDSKHEGIRYPCDQCNARPFTQIGNLRTHQASAHEGVRYPCDKCDANPFTQVGDLKKHKTSVHEGVRYGCKECNYEATNKKSVNRHCSKNHQC